MVRNRSLLERLALAVAAVALSLATLSVLVVAPSSRVQAVVDVRYLSYEPATRLN